MSAEKVYHLLKDKMLTISYAESMTGGKAMYEIIKNPGASDVVRGGMVVYHDDLKIEWLGVDELLIKEEGVVSQAVARQLARKIQEKTNASIGIGITGNAGPTCQEGEAGLLSWIAISYQHRMEDIEIIFDGLTREEAIDVTVDALYQRLEELLQ
jgi:PncC family amidohydrolase